MRSAALRSKVRIVADHVALQPMGFGSTSRQTRCTMELDQQIRKYLVENLLYVDDASQYDNDTSFIREGLIDSMGVMELVAFIQSEFGVTTENHEVVVENFDSVGKLANFVRRKLSLSKRGASLPATERAREPASLVNPGSGKILSDHELLSRDRGAE